MFTSARETPLEPPSVNSSVLHSLSTPSFGVEIRLKPLSSVELVEGDAIHLLGSSSHTVISRTVGEREEADANSALSFPLDPLNDNRPNHRDPKLRSGKGFPFKLYFMLEDETLRQYVSWSKSKGKDAFSIPDIEAFVANALPKHFEEMKQKQLNNYDFKRQDRGPDKAVYAHSVFLQGRPDLLANVRCRSKRRTAARRGPKRPSSPIPITAGNKAPASGSQTNYPLSDDQLECDNKELRREVSELKVRLQTAETGLQLMQETVLEMREQLKELLKKPEGISTGGGALDSMVDPGSAQSLHQFDVLHSALIPSTDAGGEALGCPSGSLQTLPLEAYMSMGLAYNPVDPLIGFEFLAP
ncbi:hypothetical protein FS837_001837 [Tulasnella sp. UAMH 9824]|nr:hypothetical protein FS837_001837 [Tulasnella sp. UAMH 9824]